MKKYLVLLLSTLFFAVSCSDDINNDPGPGHKPTSVWDLSHRDYLLLKGNVAHIEEQFTDMTDPEDPYTINLLTAELDNAGHVTLYNPTGEDLSVASQRRTRGWGPAADAFIYTYDAQGRMTKVSRYTLGEPDAVTYLISYGDHKDYIPMPFAVMDRPIWLLQGVTEVTGSNGYTLHYADGVANESYPAVWGGQKQVITSLYQHYPLQSITLTFVNQEQVSRATTNYTWGEAGNLLATNMLTVKPEEVSTREVVIYDSRFPYGPQEKSIYEGEEQVVRLVYLYYTDGELFSVRYAKGQESEWFGDAFTKEYTDLDANGNWLKCLKVITSADPAVQMPITRTLTYW